MIRCRFQMVWDGTDPDAVKAYTHLWQHFCEMGKSAKKVNAQEKVADNDKYAIRCFLLGWAFIVRRTNIEQNSLKNLSGNSSFRSQRLSQEDLVRAKADPTIRAEIRKILEVNDDEQ